MAVEGNLITACFVGGRSVDRSFDGGVRHAHVGNGRLAVGLDDQGKAVFGQRQFRNLVSPEVNDIERQTRRSIGGCCPISLPQSYADCNAAGHPKQEAKDTD